MISIETPCTAFEGSRCIARGALKDVALAAKTAMDRWADSHSPMPVLIFNDATSTVIELDWRGTVNDFQARLELSAQNHAAPGLASSNGADAGLPAEAAPSPEVPRGPGRPKLGVVAREVTLLPRHWEWLGSQPGGASVALRKLVEVARRSSEVTDRVRQASAVCYKFMSTMAGHEAGFEEASRALFAGDPAGFEANIAAWPVDVQAHVRMLATGVFPA